MDAELLRACRDLTFGVAGALTAKPLLERLLGPSFDYVGGAMADLLTRYGNENVREIFRRAAEKVSSQAVDGGVSPRVLKAVVEEGSFVRDPGMQQYFAGLLAASFSGDGADEVAVTFVNLLKNLTASQIKMHYLFYSLVRLVHNPPRFKPLPAEVDGEMFIPHRLLAQHVGATSINERRHVIRGLVHEGLLGGRQELCALAFDPQNQGAADGVIVAATPLGAELFLWVHGARNAAPEMLCSANTLLQDWGGGTIDTHGVLRGASLNRQREAARRLVQIHDLCAVGAGSIAARDNIDRHLRELFTSKLRVWVPRDFRRWSSTVSFAGEPAHLDELKRNLGRSLALLAR